MISITLPSIYPAALTRTLRNIEATTRGPYEVIVVSQEPPSFAPLTVCWLQEYQPRGCAYAHSRAAAHAIGDYLVPFADDHEFVAGWDEIVMRNFTRRAPPDRPFALGLRGAHSGHVGTNFGLYYPYFPMMRRADVRNLGWINPDYEAGFGDSDLAMRVWHAGGRCEWSDEGLLRPTQEDKRKEIEAPAISESRRPAAAYTEADLALFSDRWGSIYGVGWPPNVPPEYRPWKIDEFNVDILPEENAALCSGNTVIHNDPAFLGIVTRMTV